MLVMLTTIMSTFLATRHEAHAASMALSFLITVSIFMGRVAEALVGVFCRGLVQDWRDCML